MIGSELIINFNGDSAFLTETKTIPLDNTNILGIYRKFPPASWKVRVLHFSPYNRQIHAEVISYNPFALEFPDEQYSENAELHEVDAIHFRSIDTYGLLRSYSGRKNAEPYFPGGEPVPVRRKENQNLNTSQESKNTEIKLSLEIPIDQIQFKEGRVVFNQYIGQLSRNMEFEVLNPNLKEEFDSVKDYFANVLKKKKLEFQIVISLSMGEVTNKSVTSYDIARIDKKIIEQSRLELADQVLRNSSFLAGDQLLFTVDELIKATTGKDARKVYYADDNSFFEDILSITNSKHYKHLRYLSEQHIPSVVKLRFVTHPFSFIFFVQGDSSSYFVWETLHTEEATYVWRGEKEMSSIKILMQRVDSAIKAIERSGRRSYINTAGEGFFRIYHDYSKDRDGFLNWKNEMESVLA